MNTGEMQDLPIDATVGAGRYADSRVRLQLVEWIGRSRLVTSISALPHDLPVRILDGSPEAILICDRAGTVRYWNAAAERVFGFPVTEALGASMNLIIPEPFRDRHWVRWEAAMKTGVTRYGEGQLLAVPALHKDGRRISIEFSIQFIKDPDGQTTWVVATIRDVTERYRREKTLRAQLEAAEQAGASPTSRKRGNRHDHLGHDPLSY
jgi:PAS domain S-box-containing protein